MFKIVIVYTIFLHYVKFQWRHSRLNNMSWQTTLPYMNTFGRRVSEELCSQDLTMLHYALNSPSSIIPTKFVETKWHQSRLNYMSWLTILPNMNIFCYMVSEELRSQDLTMLHNVWNIQSPTTSINYVELQWRQSRLNYMSRLIILPNPTLFQRSCVHKILLCYTIYKIVQV